MEPKFFLFFFTFYFEIILDLQKSYPQMTEFPYILHPASSYINILYINIVPTPGNQHWYNITN